MKSSSSVFSCSRKGTCQKIHQNQTKERMILWRSIDVSIHLTKTSCLGSIQLHRHGTTNTMDLRSRQVRIVIRQPALPSHLISAEAKVSLRQLTESTRIRSQRLKGSSIEHTPKLVIVEPLELSVETRSVLRSSRPMIKVWRERTTPVSKLASQTTWCLSQSCIRKLRSPSTTPSAFSPARETQRTIWTSSLQASTRSQRGFRKVVAQT